MDICLTNQQDFIHSSFRFYRRKTLCWGETYHREDVIEWLYKLGRDYNVLCMDYSEFRRVLRKEHNHYTYWSDLHYYRRRRFVGRYTHNCAIEWYRLLRGFTYSGQVKKNKPTENDWWTHKGVLKTKRKANWGHHWKKNLKHFCKRKHRQLEREAIKTERYDRLHRLTYKQAEDPWSWD